MKNLTTLCLLTISSLVTGQDTLNYEQIAFDFFKKEVLPTYSKKKRLTVFIYTTKTLDYLLYPICDKAPNAKVDTLYHSTHQRISIDVKGDRRFQLKNGKASIYVEWVFSKGDINIVSIVDFSQDDQALDIAHYLGIAHYIEIDRNGHVVKWCRNDNY